MPDLPVYKNRRLVLVRFQRATTGNPDIDRPDIDDRGGARPIVGLTAGRTITVRLTRERIDRSARLFLTSSAPTIVDMPAPLSSELPNTIDMDILLVGRSGGNPSVGRIEIRYGSETGPIIHELEVWVFTPLALRITPHMVRIRSATAGPVGSAANIATIIDLVRAIWAPCGLTLTVAPTVTDTHTFAVAGEVTWAELTTLMGSASFVPSTINAYFVNRITLAGNPGVLGLGISRTNSVAFGLPNPGIILADTNATGHARAGDAMWLANDLAHEIGHFLQLEHCERGDPSVPPGVREDQWSRRSLMHNFNTQGPSGDWRDRFGYGMAGADVRRGCFVSMKNLAQLVTDGECTTARATITSASGPY